VITFILWRWKQTPPFREDYSVAHVNAMVEMISRRVRCAHRIVCITDDPSGISCDTFPIWRDHDSLKNPSGKHLPSCHRRLRLFHRATTDTLGIARGAQVVSIDLDGVIVSDSFAELFNREEYFVGWMVPGHRHRVVFNGSMFMFRAGTCDYLWTEFDPLTSPKKALMRGFLGSDQAWITMNMMGRPGVGGWTARANGVRSWLRDVRMPGRFSEKDTSVVFFPGNSKPWHSDVLKLAPWILRHTSYGPPTKQIDGPVEARA